MELPPTRYRIVPRDPHAHVFEVRCTVERPDAHGQRLRLPAWIPGSYLVREFARQFVAVRAECDGRPVRIAKESKDTWRCEPCNGTLTVTADVHAFDLSVRAAYLDASRAFFNGASVFLCPEGRAHLPCVVDIAPSEATRAWRVATTLPRHGAPPWGYGAYRAADYDELIDHPVEIADFAHVAFEAGGATHDVVVSGRHDADLARLAGDLARICQWHVDLFGGAPGGRAPFDRYLFLVNAVGDGYGGLEHRTSTALIAARDALPRRGRAAVDDDYRGFLGLASHEYFHAWNVKRIRPASFLPYDLARECYTRQLWAFEGFTSYYDDLALLRSGVVDLPGWLELAGRTITTVLRTPGRRVQSVAESSFDAWIKYYRQDENSPNAIASYYAKGSLVALALDLTIRIRTGGKRSLDDAMRLMWRRYGRDFFARREGLAEDEFPRLLEEATGLRLDAQIRSWAYGTAELSLVPLLRAVGVEPGFGPGDQGPASLGAKLATREGQLTITTAYTGQAAQRAGLSAGDTLVAVDGLRIDERALKALLARRKPGDRLRVHAFRRDELFDCEIELDAPPATDAKLKLAPKPGARAARLLAGWLGGSRPARASRAP